MRLSLPPAWHGRRADTFRYRLYAMAGQVVRHARQWTLKVGPARPGLPEETLWRMRTCWLFRAPLPPDPWPLLTVRIPVELDLNLKIPVTVGQDAAANEPASPEMPKRIAGPEERMKTNYSETGPTWPGGRTCSFRPSSSWSAWPLRPRACRSPHSRGKPLPPLTLRAAPDRKAAGLPPEP